MRPCRSENGQIMITTLKEKRAKMALDRSPEFLRLPKPFFFFLVPFRKNLQEFLCLCSASSPHSLIPCLLTDQNFANNF